MNLGSFVRKDLALFLVVVFLSSSLYSCAGGGGSDEKTSSLSLAPLPKVTIFQEITLLGHAGLEGSQVTVKGGAQDESVATMPGSDGFQCPVTLNPGLNHLEVSAAKSGKKGGSAAVDIIYDNQQPLVLDSVQPGTGQSGSILDLTGTGFTPDREKMHVFFRGSRQEGQGIVLDATDTTMQVAVPFIFMDTDEDLDVYIDDGAQASNSIIFHVVPAEDPTPLEAGNEMSKQFDLLITQSQRVLAKTQQILEPLLTPDQWSPIQENLNRIGQFFQDAKNGLLSDYSQSELSRMDAIFGSDIFAYLDQKLQEINDILSHSSWGETACEIGEVQHTMGVIIGVLEDIDYLLIAADVVCFFVCQPALPVIEMTRQIIEAVLDAIGAIAAIMDMTPTKVAATSWRVNVEGPYPGIDPHVIFTGTDSRVSLMVDFTNGEGKQAVGRLSSIGSVILDLLGIDLPEIIKEDVPVNSVDTIDGTEPPAWYGTAQPFGLDLLTLSEEGQTAEAHTASTMPAVFSTSRHGTVNLDIQGSCGPYHYPDQVCLGPTGMDPGCMTGNIPHYDDLFPVDVIYSPIIDGRSWQSDNDSWVFWGEGFSTDCGTTFKVFYNGEEVDCMCLQNLTTTSFETSPACPIFRQPGRIQVVIVDPSDPDNPEKYRQSPTEEIPPSPRYGVEVDSTLPPAGFIGDTMTVFGEYFSPYVEDMELTFYDDQDQAVAYTHPLEAVTPSPGTDHLTFAIPEELHGMEGKTVKFRLHVGTSYGFTNASAFGQFDLKRAESAAWGDQDLLVFDQPDYYLRTAIVGDLDGDGENDLVVGVPEYRFQGYAVGKVYIAFGPVEGQPLSTGQEYIDLAHGDPADRDWDVEIIGDMTGSNFGPGAGIYGGNSRRIGNALAIGDVNGDGIDDLLLGSTDQNDLDLHQYNLETRNPTHIPGKAYLFYGRSRSHWMATDVMYVNMEYGIPSIVRRDYDVLVHGDDARELGYQVATGDFNGDGYRDMVVSAPTDPVIPGTPNDQLAAAYVVFGSQSLPGDVDVGNIPAGVPGVRFLDEDAWQTPLEGDDYRGTGLGKDLSVGDVNGDGLDDLLLGAPGFERISSGYLTRGAAYLLYGGSAFGGNGSMTLGLFGGQQDVLILGPQLTSDENNRIGRPLKLGDLNGDGRAEVILGSPHAHLHIEDTPGIGSLPVPTIDEDEIGKVYVVDALNVLGRGSVAVGQDSGLMVNGSLSFSRFGMDVETADVNGDGIGDLLVGAPGRLDNPLPGRVWGRYGSAVPGSLSGTIQLTGIYNHTTVQADPDDFLISGDQSHAGHFDNQGFGTFIATGDLSPYVGDDVIVIDPLARAPDVPLPPPPAQPGWRDYAGMLYTFYEGSTALRYRPNVSPLELDQPVTGSLEAGDEDAYGWTCTGDTIFLDIAEEDGGGNVIDPDPGGLHSLFFDEHQMIFDQGYGDMTGVLTPASGPCGLVVSNENPGPVNYGLTVSIADSTTLSINPENAVMEPCESSRLFSATGGEAPYIFSFVDTMIPIGVTLTDNGDGTASVDVGIGICVDEGTALTLEVIDGLGGEALSHLAFLSQGAVLGIAPNQVTLSPCDFSQWFIAAGGSPFYAFTLIEVAPPFAGSPVLTDNGDGTADLSGCVEGTGAYNVEVRDSVGSTADAAVLLEPPAY